jgi:DNA-directed RNA polymerase subunit N (RpoN/RPB10)
MYIKNILLNIIMEWSDEELKIWKENIDKGVYINPKTHRKIKEIGPTNKNLEKEFKKRLNLNFSNSETNEIDIKEEIQYPSTMPIMCFSCNTVISRIGILNTLWNIYINNIDNNMEYIDEKFKDNMEKSKWMNKIKSNWWQKIGGFEEIRDGIELNFTISNKKWKDIGIENLCCRRMIYTHEENPLFVYGPSNY